MNEDTEKSLKKEMGYSEGIHKCGTCKFYKEIENPHLDRDWIDTCKFNSIGSITIKSTGICKHWKKSVKK